ncbi:MAG: sensor histidine kinase [Gammaproteobacteria bacterium]
MAVAAGLVLLGWAADIEPLKRIRPGWVAMNPTTALLFLLAAAALWLQAGPQRAARFAGASRAAQALAGLVAVAGAVKLGEHLGLAVPAVDQWLFALQLAPDAERGFARNEMAPNTAVAFVLVGMALALLDRGTAPGRRPAEWLAAGSALIALLALLGYAYRIEAMYGVSRFIPMAMNTAALFLLLALGLFAARPTMGVAALFEGGRPSGRMARWLLAGSVAIIAGIGWLRLEGERAGLYGTELGVTLHSVVLVALLSLLVASSAWVLRRAEHERRRAEVERERALARNRQIMANSLDVICTIDGDGRFVDVSPAARRLWGYAPEELAGREYMALVHPDDRDATARVASSIRAGEPTVDFSNRYLRSDGTPVVVDWSAAWSEPDQLMFCVARDATRRRQAEEAIHALNAELHAQAAELRQSNRELESFSYTVSHDLRAPLRHIDGYARMLQEDAADTLDGDCRRYLDEIGIAARRMGALIDDLLAYSRLGRKPLERVPLDMRRLVERVVEECGGAGKVEVGPLPEAQADPVLLRQVWVNLVSNALKYSAPRGDDARVEIDGWREGDRLEYRIRDNGVGFDMRFADKLFGVFQRLHSQEDFEGTGVGLAIVQQIVARHGGGIRADATPGAGAAFTFDLPAGAHAGQSALAREDAA